MVYLSVLVYAHITLGIAQYLYKVMLCEMAYWHWPDVNFQNLVDNEIYEYACDMETKMFK